MNVLVTGGAGYIGSAAAEALLKAGHVPLIFDNLSRGHAEAVPPGVGLVVGDVGDAAALDAVFAARRIDAVLHFAALIEVAESMQAPQKYFRNNTAAVLTLLEAMQKHGVGKFVFSSTAALFGNPEQTPIREDDPHRPLSPYGESKLMTEHLLDWFNRAYGFRFACLRYFNVAGAASPDRGEAHDPESHLIPLILKVALGQRSAISVFGTDYPTADGTCIRDYVHVSDLVQAHLLALEALSTRERMHFNLGNGNGFSIREVIAAARKVTGHAIPAVDAPRRPGDPASLVASSERICSELGWKPRYSSLEDIIGSAWEWHRRHPHGYRT